MRVILDLMSILFAVVLVSGLVTLIRFRPPLFGVLRAFMMFRREEKLRRKLRRL